jgi:hypothetical protein
MVMWYLWMFRLRQRKRGAPASCILYAKTMTFCNKRQIFMNKLCVRFVAQNYPIVFFISPYTNPVIKWSVIYLCAKDIDFLRFFYLILELSDNVVSFCYSFYYTYTTTFKYRIWNNEKHIINHHSVLSTQRGNDHWVGHKDASFDSYKYNKRPWIQCCTSHQIIHTATM